MLRIFSNNFMIIFLRKLFVNYCTYFFRFFQKKISRNLSRNMFWYVSWTYSIISPGILHELSQDFFRFFFQKNLKKLLPNFQEIFPDYLLLYGYAVIQWTNNVFFIYPTSRHVICVFSMVVNVWIKYWLMFCLNRTVRSSCFW